MEVKGTTVPWSVFFWRLQTSSPYSAYWSVREVDEDVALPELFEALALEVVQSAESLDGITMMVPADKDYTMTVPGVTVSTPNPEGLAAEVGGPTHRFEPHTEAVVDVRLLRRRAPHGRGRPRRHGSDNCRSGTRVGTRISR